MRERDPVASESKTLLAWAIGVFAVVAAVWLPAVGGEFVWDDLSNLVESDRLRSWSAVIDSFRHNAMWSADRPQAVVGTYRPLSLASFVIDYKIYGLEPWGYHLTNVLLHAVTAALLFVFFARATVAPRAAAALAVLWAVHPVCAEAVAWVNGRSEVIALLFGVGALALAATPRLGAGRLVGVSICVALAMLGKETGAIFAPLAVFVAGESDARRRRWLHPSAAAAVGSAIIVYALLRHAALEGGAATGLGGAMTALSALPAVWAKALQAALLPLDLSIAMLHGWLVAMPAAEQIGYAVAAVALVAGVAGLWWRGERLGAVGLAWWLASLTPVAAVVFLDWPGLNRWLYIGLPGLLLALWRVGLRHLPARTAAVMLAITGAGWIAQSERAIRVWQHDGALFMQMVEEYPDRAYGYAGLGAWMRRIGRHEEATEVLERAVELGPNRVEPYLLLSASYATLDRCAESAEVLMHNVDRAFVPPAFTRAVAHCFERGGQLEPAARLYALCADALPDCAERGAALGAH